jgi:UV DNA damage repair endonuclease
MIRFGLRCMFRDQPIKFRTTTAAAVARIKRTDGLVKVSSLCLTNADALLASLRFCADNGIGCFRINSQILPLKTHLDYGHDVHHHRCNRDGLSEEEATEHAVATWDREPLIQFAKSRA